MISCTTTNKHGIKNIQHSRTTPRVTVTSGQSNLEKAESNAWLKSEPPYYVPSVLSLHPKEDRTLIRSASFGQGIHMKNRFTDRHLGSSITIIQWHSFKFCPSPQKTTQGPHPLAKFSAKISVVLLHLNTCIGIMSALPYIISRSVSSHGSKFGTQLQCPWVFFIFLSILFLLAAMWPNQIQLAVRGRALAAKAFL